MNKKYIKDFVENETITTPLLVNNVVKGMTNSSAPYLSITFGDKTGTIEGKVWDVKEKQVELAVVGQVLAVNCDIIKYKNNLQLKVHDFVKLEENEYDINDFVAASVIPLESLKNEVYKTLEGISDQILKDITTKIVEDYAKEFFLHPAASKNHHNYVSGLAEHVCGMLKLGKAICATYPFLNKDLLLCGIILHDIGKLKELSGTIATEYTLEGKLLGHISIMQTILTEKAIELGYEETEQVVLLRHMILSHHGKYEFGSPVLPMIPEAEALSVIDNMDARMNMMSKAINEVKPGEFTAKIFSLENRSIYRSKLK